VGALLCACLVSFTQPGLKLLFPLSLPDRTKPLTFSRGTALPASRDCLASPAAASTLGSACAEQLEGAARRYGAQRDAPPLPMPLVLGSRCRSAEGDLWEGEQRGNAGSKGAIHLSHSQRRRCCRGRVGWLFLLWPHHRKPQGPFGRPTLFSPSLQLGILLQPSEQSSSLGWCMVLDLGLRRVWP